MTLIDPLLALSVGAIGAAVSAQLLGVDPASLFLGAAVSLAVSLSRGAFHAALFLLPGLALGLVSLVGFPRLGLAIDLLPVAALCALVAFAACSALADAVRRRT